MKMRARMVDGSPLTFESIDHGGVKYRDYGNPEWKIRAPYTTEFVGEGFHVISKWSGQATYYADDDPVCLPRLAYDRWSLERSGVDTATVEYLDCLLEHRFDRLLPSDLREHWLRMWPSPQPSERAKATWPFLVKRLKERVGDPDAWVAAHTIEALVRSPPMMVEPQLKEEPATAVPGSITYMGEDELISEAMLANGCARLHEALIEGARLDSGMIVMRNPGKAVSSIWRSMRSAQRLHGSK